MAPGGAQHPALHRVRRQLLPPENQAGPAGDGRLTCDEHFELFGRAYRLPPEAERRSRKDIYASLDFERYAATRADQLTGGTLSKLNLGLALLADPEVLLLDEPYAGFDFDTYLTFWELAGPAPSRLVASRMTTGLVLALLAAAASLAATATVFEARQWGLYIAANTLIALTTAAALLFRRAATSPR
ncbi:hypothetical protein L1856_02120 [Streptomyces sp. Tue 6430]|nr:hypothetical protein [Streptomyces sp. Tue 6430]